MATIPALPFTGLALRNTLVEIDGEVAGKATPADITAAVGTKADAVHTHAIADTTGLQSALDGKAEVSHTHTIGNVTGLQAALDGKQPTTTFKTINGQTITGTGDITVAGGGTTTWAGITDKPAVIAAGATQADARTAIGAGTSSLAIGTTASTAKAGNYVPAWGDVTGKPATFPPAAHTHAWGDVTGKPTTFAPSAHSHAIADTTGLQAALDGKSAIGHTHAISDTTGLQSALDAKLARAGGTMTGPLTLAEVRETQSSLGTELTPDNGTVQIKTLTAALTLTEGAWDDGQAVVVTYTGGDAYAITHPAAWKKSDGFPSTMKPVQEVVYRKVGGVIRYSPGAGWAS